MSFVIAAPEMMTAAATDLAAIGSNVDAAHLVAAARTTSVIPAAADEVSTGIAQLFSAHAANYHATAAQAAAINDQFVQNLTAGAFSYASAEAVNVSFLFWLVQNAGLYEAIQYLWETLSINYPFLQLLDYVLAPIRVVLGVGLLLLFFAAIWVLALLGDFLGQFGL
jgi:hypothetical protein